MGFPAVLSETACGCAKCQALCAHSTCLPTPQEAITLIERGYAERLQRYNFGAPEFRFIGPKIVGREGVLPRTNMGRCAFFTDDGRCELHEIGLKPYEGRIAQHDRDWHGPRAAVMARWRQGDYPYVESKLIEKGV